MSERRTVRSAECTAGRTVSRREASVATVTICSLLTCRPNETTPTIVLSGKVTGEGGGERRERHSSRE